MKIHGLQKMTLLDFPGHVACTVFLGGCDLRCPYCHNYELATGQAPPIMEEAELFSFLEKRKGLLDGVAITGGEPCLHPDLPDFIGRIRALGYPVKLDTNGTHPAVLREVLERGLVDYVAMDIKNSPAKYALTAGIAQAEDAPQPAPFVEKIRESAGLLMAAQRLWTSCTRFRILTRSGSGSQVPADTSCSALQTAIRCPSGD